MNKSSNNTWIRLSLYYPMTVLAVAGSGLLVLPGWVLSLLQSSEAYPSVMVQFAGMFMLVLSVFVFKVIQEALVSHYRLTIYLRLFMSVCLTGFYVQTSNILFLVVLAILLVGLLLSGIGIILDRQ
ncbi:MAG: hypothetical protein AAFV80_13475 [Bacteroidota bacterium]